MASLIALLCFFHISYFGFVLIKMSKTIQLSWAIDYSDPHFSGNGKSFNQDQARSKIFNSPLFLCRIWSSPFVSKSWTPREGSKTDVKIWPDSAVVATHISQGMAGFVQEPAQIRIQRKTLCNSPNFSSFSIGVLPCYSFASAKRVIGC